MKLSGEFTETGKLRELDRLPADDSREGSMFFLGVAVGVAVPLMVLAFGS